MSNSIILIDAYSIQPEPTLDPPTPFTCPIDIPDGSVDEDGACCEFEDCKSGLCK